MSLHWSYCFQPTDYATVSRDPQRTPMQWSTEMHAGFSTANHTWLPVAEDYVEWNVQVSDKPSSMFYFCNVL